MRQGREGADCADELGLAAEEARDVDEVAGLLQHLAAALGLAAPPGGGRGADVELAEGHAHRAFGDQRPDQVDGVHRPPLEARRGHEAGRVHPGGDVLGGGEVEGDRLLDQERDARLDQRAFDRTVLRRGDGDQDRVGAAFGEEAVEVDEGRAAPRGRCGLGASGVAPEVRDDHDLHGIIGDGPEMPGRDRTGSDDAQPQPCHVGPSKGGGGSGRAFQDMLFAEPDAKSAKRLPGRRELEQGSEVARFEKLNRFGSLPEAILAARREHGGDRVAFEDIEGTSLTYGQLALAGAVLERALRARFAPGERVGVILPAAPGAVAVLLAFWRSGRVPAMLNPTAGTGPVLSALADAEVQHGDRQPRRSSRRVVSGTWWPRSRARGCRCSGPRT